MFGKHILDIERGSLTRDGEPVELRPKSFNMLRYLLEHAGELVSRQELLDAVWPGLVVTEDSVAQCLIELRRALGDDERTIIRTVQRRGVILDVPVHFEQHDGQSAPDRSSRKPVPGWILGAALVAVVAAVLWWALTSRPASQSYGVSATPPAVSSTIAVLRFTDLSPGANQAYLADGLGEEILHSLAQSPDLTVIARSSSFAVEGEAVDTIAQRLGVSHVLEGSLRRQGDDIRVTAQLIDARTSAHLWSRTYDRKIDDILAMQREIAGAVADELEVSLASAGPEAGIDPRAYSLFLEGQYLYRRRADGDQIQAQKKFEEAVAISADFARAWASLAATVVARMYDANSAEITAEERENLLHIQQHAIEQALAHGADLTEAHHRAAQYYFYHGGDKERAQRHLENARSIDPDHWLVRNALAHELRKLGRIDEAIAIARQDIRRDPLNFAQRINLVHHLIRARRFKDARAELDRLSKMLTRTESHSQALAHALALQQVLTNDYESAVQQAESLPDGPLRWKLLALAQSGLGSESESTAALERLISEAGTGREALYVAEVYAQKGNVEESMRWLQQIEFADDCVDDDFTESVYYSPFLAKLDGLEVWHAYRSNVAKEMEACLFGLDVSTL